MTGNALSLVGCSRTGDARHQMRHLGAREKLDQLTASPTQGVREAARGALAALSAAEYPPDTLHAGGDGSENDGGARVAKRPRLDDAIGGGGGGGLML